VTYHTVEFVIFNSQMSLQNFVPCQLWQAYFLGSLSRRFPQCEQVTWTSSTSVAVAYCCCCCCCSCCCYCYYYCCCYCYYYFTNAIILSEQLIPLV